MTATIDQLIAAGTAHLREGRLAEAEESCRRVLAIDPGNVDALNNFGVCHYELGRLDQAEACFRSAIELRPKGASSWNNLGSILLERGDPDAAAPFFEEAVARNPGYAVAQSNRLMCEQYRSDVTPERLLMIAREWAARFASRSGGSPVLDPAGEKRVRVGFFSADLYRAPMGYFLVGLLEALDLNAVETYIYSDTLQSDDLTQRLRNHVNIWSDVRGMDDAGVVGLARSHRLDVAIDAAGHTKGNRLGALASRVAPVQILWAGYAGSTGVPAIDFIFADRIQVPEGQEMHYSEKVLRLPHDYICYSPPEYSPPVGPLPARRAGCVTFGGFHNAAKAGPVSLDLWSRVLAAVRSSRLLLKYMKLDDARNSDRIRRAFAAAGVDPGRVVIEGISPHLAMLARYNDVDIALDSLPYSGGLTTLEALWMGVPVITLPGGTFAGRHAATHVTNAGFPGFVASNERDYVGIAAGLAADLPALESLRARLRPALAASPVCDTRGFARDFLAAILAVRKDAWTQSLNR